MTWEWVVLILGFAICLLHMFDTRFKASKEISTLEKVLDLEERFSLVQDDHENIKRLADETKKLLSQQHLANNFRAR